MTPGFDTLDTPDTLVIMSKIPQTQNLSPDTLPKESHVRSILKGFTWRILATTTTILITYFITGRIDTAVKVGILEFIGKILIYYFHERLWQLVPRGTIHAWLKKNFTKKK